ncbi:MAG: NACHT domain-containing protein [Nostoc desertorum CM1-VF14]|jgi:predicted NACHT family NTPase|nr:NACHT domain-containing protein [Nostoc desertorum CM1-VF14]
MKETISATPEGLVRAKRALQKLYGTQEKLIDEEKHEEGGVGRSTISKFFNGKKIQVGEFKRICIALKLESEWQKIAGLVDSPDSVDLPVFQTVEPTLETQDNGLDIDRLVPEVREKVKTDYEKRYGTLKLLGMHEHVNLELVYTPVFLENFAIRSFEPIDQLERSSRQGSSQRFQSQDKGKQKGITVANNKQYLMVLGEAGTGKSTFLRKVGLEALKKEGGFNHDCIPVFIELKRLKGRNINIENFIAEEFRTCEVPEPEQFTSQALKKGKLLILLDGLDEVPKKFLIKAISEIQTFVNKYDKNRFIVSCRTAAYCSTFHRFYDVKIAEFDDNQIQQFIYNWFNCEADEQANKADKCWELLQKPENSAVKRLAYTPLFLTFLCLIYDRFQNFPDNRSRLVKKVVRLLLEEWASQKLIDQDEIYPELHSEEEEKLLSEIAYTSFESDRLFLNEDEIVQKIKTFLETNFNAPKYLNGRAVLTAITVQQGILVERAVGVFSFSHLTIHEYLTAKYIVDHDQS